MKYGPKFSILKQLVKKETDFLILTETKTHFSSIKNRKIKYGLTPTLFTRQLGARGGVIVFNNPQWEIINESKIESSQLGHFVMAVFQKNAIKIILVGVYGRTDNADKESMQIFQEMKNSILELKTRYGTNLMIVAGDFNSVLEENDSSNGKIIKYRTSNFLNDLCDDLDLKDLGDICGNKTHTWNRPGKEKQSSRIDYVLANFGTQYKYRLINTIFDHAAIAASINKHEIKVQTSIKDYVLVSQAFLEDFQKYAEKIEAKYKISSSAHGNSDEGGEQAQRINNKLHCQQTNALEVLNEIIINSQLLHNIHLKENKALERNLIEKTNRELSSLLAKKSKEKDKIRLATISEKITEIKKALANICEAKELASLTRINNFFTNEIGKCTPTSFQIMKEKKVKKDIAFIQTENGQINDREEVTQFMQNWYKNSASCDFHQEMDLNEFLHRYGIELPKLNEIEAEELEKEITKEEITWALKVAKVNSAAGFTGQNISFYKLLFAHFPDLFTAAINQMIFIPNILDQPHLKWIRSRKIIYIPKTNNPTNPSDFRPLSMLEVFYKIPSRILTKRMSAILPKIIGSHQYGFMQERSIQQPILLATQAIQIAQKERLPLQLISFDIEKAFDKVSHAVIKQALYAFNFPPSFINAIANLALSGVAKVQVNNEQSEEFPIKGGSGQGDPLSAPLFLVSLEPLNLAMNIIHEVKFFKYRGFNGYMILFADDNLAMLSLKKTRDIDDIMHTYQDYFLVSGLKINPKKTLAICINTEEQIKLSLNRVQIQIKKNMRYLGIELAETIEQVERQTFEKIDPKKIIKKILISSAPTDLLHRSLLLKMSYSPIYNHIFMSIPISKETSEKLNKEFLGFLWERRKENVTIQKRRLVSKIRIDASFSMGGLQLQYPEKTIQGLQLNLIQKSLMPTDSTVKNLIDWILKECNCNDLETHINALGPKQWEKTSTKIKNLNKYAAQVFFSVYKYMLEAENGENWPQWPIFGHSEESILFPITAAEFVILQQKNIEKTSQILTADTGLLPDVIIAQLADYPLLKYKIVQLAQNIKRKHWKPSNREQTINISFFAIQTRGKKKLSWCHRKLNRSLKDRQIRAPPALATRKKDGVDWVELETFKKAYLMIKNPLLSSKTKENSFQTLNRTLWTNNKAYKAKIAASPNCNLCSNVETMEHLLMDCNKYAYKIWLLWSMALSKIIQEIKGFERKEANIGYRNIIFNEELKPLQLLSIKFKNFRQAVQLLIHEQRRDIYFRRTKNVLNETDNVIIIYNQRILAHVCIVLKKVTSYLQFLSYEKWKDTIKMLFRIDEILIEHSLQFLENVN